jgi:hypothetical protein
MRSKNGPKAVIHYSTFQANALKLMALLKDISLLLFSSKLSASFMGTPALALIDAFLALLTNTLIAAF